MAVPPPPAPLAIAASAAEAEVLVRKAFTPAPGEDCAPYLTQARLLIQDATTKSWSVLVPLLESEHVQVQLFAAEALQHKAARQWRLLSAEHRSEVFQALWRLLSAGTLSHIAVVRHMASALAAATALSDSSLAGTVAELAGVASASLSGAAAVVSGALQTPSSTMVTLLACVYTLQELPSAVQDVDMGPEARKAAEAALRSAAGTVLDLAQALLSRPDSPFAAEGLRELLSQPSVLVRGMAPKPPRKLAGGAASSARDTAGRALQGACATVGMVHQWLARVAEATWEELVGGHRRPLAVALLAGLRLPSAALVTAVGEAVRELLDATLGRGDHTNTAASDTASALVAASVDSHAAVAHFVRECGGEAPDVGDDAAAWGCGVALTMESFATCYRPWVVGGNARDDLIEVQAAAAAAEGGGGGPRADPVTLPTKHEAGCAFVNAVLHLMGSPCLAVATQACSVVPELSESRMSIRPGLLQQHLYAQQLHIVVSQAAYPNSFDKEGGWANVMPEVPALPAGLFPTTGVDAAVAAATQHPLQGAGLQVRAGQEAFHRFRAEVGSGSLLQDALVSLGPAMFTRVTLTSAVHAASSEVSGGPLATVYAAVHDEAWADIVSSLTPATLLQHWRRLEAAFFVLHCVSTSMASALNDAAVAQVVVPVLLPVLRSDIAAFPAPLARTLFRLLARLKRWLASVDKTASGSGAPEILSAALRSCLQGVLVSPDAEDEDEEHGDVPGGSGAEGDVHDMLIMPDAETDGSMVCAAAACAMQAIVQAAAVELSRLGAEGDLVGALARMVTAGQPGAATAAACAATAWLIGHIAAQDSERACQVMAAAVAPLVEHLSALLRSCEGGQHMADEEQLTVRNGLHCLRRLLEYASPRLSGQSAAAFDARKPLKVALHAMWPVLHAIVDGFGADEVLVSATCAVIKQLLLSLRWQLAPLAGSLLPALAALVGRYASAQPLYTLGVAVEVFAGPSIAGFELPDADIDAVHAVLARSVFCALYACTPVRVSASTAERPMAEACARLLERCLRMLPDVLAAPQGADALAAAQAALPQLKLPNGTTPPALRPAVSSPSCALELLLPLQLLILQGTDADAIKMTCRTLKALCGAKSQQAFAAALAGAAQPLVSALTVALLAPTAAMTGLKVAEALAVVGATLGVQAVAPAVLQHLRTARAAALEQGKAFGQLAEGELAALMEAWIATSAAERTPTRSVLLLQSLSSVCLGQNDKSCLMHLMP